MDGGSTDPETGSPPGGARRPPRWPLVFLAGLLVGGVLATAVLSWRDVVPSAASVEPTATSTTPRPPLISTDVLTDAGIGMVRLGMAASDYRNFFGTSPYWTGDLSSLSSDPAHECVQYAGSIGEQDVLAWVWVRDEQVQAVGVSSMASVLPGGAAGGRVDTSFGPALGDRVWHADDRWRGWQRDASVPVDVYRSTHDGLVRTLGDLDGDGRLDYGVVATPEGEQCRPDRSVPGGLAASVDPDAVAAGPAIEGDALAGLALGMSADQALAISGWQETGRPGLCAELLGPSGATAYIADGIVVGLMSTRASGGPVAGGTVADAVAAMGDGAVVEQAGQGEFGDSAVRSPDGRRFVLTAVQEPVVLDGLDIPTYLAGHDPTSDVVVSVTLGRIC